MKIGIVGAGNIGGSLGKLWAAKGHKIVFGVRDVNSAKTQKALAEMGDVRAVSIAEAVASGDVVVMAVPWGAAQETVAAHDDRRLSAGCPSRGTVLGGPRSRLTALTHTRSRMSYRTGTRHARARHPDLSRPLSEARRFRQQSSA